MNFSIFRSFLTFFNNVTFLFMIDGKSKNRFALNNVYMIVSHLPPFFDRIRTTDFFVIVTLSHGLMIGLFFYLLSCQYCNPCKFLLLVWTSHSFL
nr:MAG TPA: hypothetical protein [Caudoviricetes sp.]